MKEGTLQLPPLGLYVHLPWCERKCPYCDFNSHETRELPEARYLEALLTDLESDLDLAQGRQLSSIFIGGGTPSLFSVATIAALLERVNQRLPLTGDAEITLEANPGSAEASRFRGLRAAGINRLSLGIQSFGDEQLKALGRVHDRRQALAAVDMARSAGFDNLNLDLMHGLPGQTPTLAQHDLDQAIALQPEHLSWYQLTIEANTLFHKRPPTLPVEDALADIQDLGEGLLAAAGYRQYEVSAYARSNNHCTHNLNYWHFGDYLGIGAGAHGKITLPSEQRIQRYWKTRQPEAYMAAIRATAGQRDLGRDERPGEFCLNALRLNEGFSPEQFTATTGLALDALEPQLERLVDSGLLLTSKDNIKASELGRRFLNDVIGAFLP